jgi:NitT/TauT family transport system substrate-binding protein
MKSNRAFASFAVLSLAVGAAACGSDDDSSTADEESPAAVEPDEDGGAATSDPPAEDEPTDEAAAPEECQVSVLIGGGADSIRSWPHMVAETVGFYAEEGVVVNRLPDITLPKTVFVDEGNADLAAASGIEIMEAVGQGAELVAIYNYWNEAVEGIYTLVDGGATSLEELSESGATLGLVTERDMPTVDVSFKETGLDRDSVETVIVGEEIALMAESLENGRVDAVVGAISDLIGMRTAGLELQDVAPPELKEGPASVFHVSNGQWDDPERRDCFARFTRAWAKGTYAGDHNPDATKAISKATNPAEWEDPSFPEIYFELNSSAFRPLDPDGNYGVMYEDAWNVALQQMADAGLLDDPDSIDPSTIIDDSIIEATNDFDRDEAAATIDEWWAANGG